MTARPTRTKPEGKPSDASARWDHRPAAGGAGGGRGGITNNHPMPSPRACQYIAGKPSADNGCKCRRPAMPGSPYCDVHAEICREHEENAEMAT